MPLQKKESFFGRSFKKLSTDELETMWALLKKLYSFDGEEHDGFEEVGNLQMDEDNMELQMRILKEFEKRRMQAINKGNKM